MRYKLINKQTEETHLCDKVVVDGLDYYTEDGNVIKPIDFSKYQYQKGNGLFKDMDNMKQGEVYEVIATNNPNIDIPKVVDEVGELAYIHYKSNQHYTTRDAYHFGLGYNKSQETHPNSDEDMIEFGKHCIRQFALFQNRDDNFTKRILPEWKEQKPKTVYYNG